MTLNREKFLKEINKHEVTVLKDDGLYRHLSVREPGSVYKSFNVVTTPGFLFYYGDMGSFTFSRVKDMFDFFRDSELKINTGYWAEKLQAVDSHGSYKGFSFEKFKTNLMDYCETDSQKEWMKDQLKYIEEDEFGAVEFYRGFDNDNEHGIDLSDLWESNNDKYTYRYLWCCYAIVWTIQQYDILKAKKPEVRTLQYSINGMRRGFASSLKSLKTTLDNCLDDLHYDDIEEIKEIFNDLACQSNSFNCVSVKGIEGFDDLSKEPEVELFQ